MEKLSQSEQRLLILRYVLELNDREIGRMMRCSRSAIQRRRTSVLRNLRKQLTGELL
ncbi:MAG: sigma factor-like helix-turn-helix DNA-binding protein [Blautia massiliensis (ex Durand et al. 2017)]